MNTDEDIESFYYNEKNQKRELENLIDEVRLLKQRVKVLEDVFFCFQSADEVRRKCKRKKQIK